MNKTELIAAVAEKSGFSKKDCEKVVNATFDAIADNLAQDTRIQLVGFGTFEVRERPARMGRNPKTGEEIEIAASRTPQFKPGKTLKDAVAK